MTRWTAAVVATVVLSGLGTLGLGGTMRGSGDTAASARQAQGVAVEFFRAQNERRYDDLCGLFARGFYRTHALRDNRTCLAVLGVALAWSGKIAFRIGAVTREGDRLTVQALADGTPGRIVLVQESGSLKILDVEGAKAGARVAGRS